MKKNSRIIYSAALAVFTVIAGILLFQSGYSTDLSRQAHLKLNEDISQLNTEKINAERETELVQTDIDNIDKSISGQSFLNEHIEENRLLYAELVQNISDAKDESAKLDGEIEEKQNTLNMLSGISDKESGSSKTLKPNSVYMCPNDIEPGRYRVKGNGTLLVYGRSNSLRISENLEMLDDNSFTFDLEENERIKLDTEMQIVKMK